jgi:hypothetical protein
MNRSILLLGSTLVFGSASAYFWQEQRAGDERNAVLEARVKELESTLATTTRPPPPPSMAATVEAPTPSADTSSPPTKAPAAPAPRLALSGTGTVRNVPNALVSGPSPVFRAMRMDKLMEDPEYRAAMRSQHRMMMSSRYPDLGEALHLQPEDVDKLMDLLTDQEMANMSGQPPFGENGQVDQAAMQEWSKKLQQRQRDNEAQLAGLLGDSGVQEWQEYQKTLGARMQVKQLRGMLEGSSDPIRPDQVQPLVEAMAAEQQRMMQTQLRGFSSVAPGQRTVGMIAPAGAMQPFTPGNQVAMMEKSLEQTVQNNQRMHDAVAPYLTQRQLEQFDKYQNQQLEFQRASLRMMRASAEAEARGEVQPNGNSSSMSVSSSGWVPLATPAQ